MFVAYKKSGNNVTACRGTEWQCRMTAKGMDLGAYNTWLATITDGDGVVTYPSEGFTIVECKDEDVSARLKQLQDYININRNVGESRVYNIKWSDSKVDGSHFTGDDSAKDARILAEQWTKIRYERTRLLTDTDYMGNSDVTMSADWKTYRQTLRDLPNAQKAKTTYASITWPTKP